MIDEIRIEKKKQLYKLIVARSDVTEALNATKYFIGNITDISNTLYQPFFHSIVISYSRPFTRNKPLGPLSKEWENFSEPIFQFTHNTIIQARHQFIAHSDEGIRKVTIYPPGATIGKTNLKSKNIGVSISTTAFPIEQFKYIKETCHDLGYRLNSRIDELLIELYKNAKLPSESFPLNFDNDI